MHLEISISIVEYTCEDYMFAQLIVLWLYLSTTLKVNAEVAQSLEETSIAAVWIYYTALYKVMSQLIFDLMRLRPLALKDINPQRVSHTHL
jgi:hypothetical protein